MLGGTWEGFEVAAAALEMLANDLTRDDVIAAALIKAERPAVLEMRQSFRRRPPAPDAADAITAAYSAEESGPGDVVVKVGPRKAHKHAHIVRFWELGTSRNPADGTMRRVQDSHQGQLTQRFVSAITPAFAASLKRAMAFAEAQKNRRTPFQRMKQAKTKAEFKAAMDEWVGGGA